MGLVEYIAIFGLLGMVFFAWRNSSARRKNDALMFAVKNSKDIEELAQLKREVDNGNTDFEKAYEDYVALRDAKPGTKPSKPRISVEFTKKGD